ncbi:MAG: carboxymuconolactone decarboxylase family protein [Pseudomonadota bacterium]|nr:carboxymuconolactone decarboxylase family protein [Pseudomonadota bacterium]
MVMATAYADICSKPGLGLRDSSLITFIVLAVQEQQKELRVHLRGLANQGVSRLEAEEMMMHISIYVGWPKALEARSIMTEVFDELKIS